MNLRPIRSSLVRAFDTVLPALPGLLALAAALSSTRAQVQLAQRFDTQLPGLVDADPPATHDIAAGDVDGDGDQDLLVLLHYGHPLLLRNDGEGVFATSPVVLSNWDRRSCAVLVDVDGDGDLDLFLAGGTKGYGSAGRCTLAQNDGTGTFTETATLPAPGGVPPLLLTRSVAFGDLDGDGDQDLVLSTTSHGLLVWQNDGTGTFTDATAATFPGGTPPANGLRLVDADLDGDLDLLTPACLQNDGAGHFTPLPGWPFSYEVADLDGDGDQDALGWNQVWRNDGGLGFTPTGALPASYAGWLVADRRAVVDVDGDGRLDLVGTDAWARPLLLRNVGSMVFEDATATWFPPHALVALTQGDPQQGLTWPVSVAFDADGDGDLDLLTGGQEGRPSSSTTVGIPPSLFLNSANTAFEHANRPAFPWLQDQSAAIAAGDVDGDGDQDLVFSYLGYLIGQPKTALWRQDRAGHFAEDAAALTSRMLSAAALVDVDGDGDLDLFGVAGVGPELLWPAEAHVLAQNDGSGHFTDVSATRLPATAVSMGASCAVGDVDGDGDPDLVVGSYDPSLGSGVPLMLLLNDGTGAFTDASAQLPALAVNARSLALRDLDGDGDLDLLVADGRSWFSSPVPTRYLANDGSGTFVDVTAARVPAGAGWGTWVQDLDGDGDLDVAQANATLWNDGTGAFTATATPGGRLLAADFDRDGTPDDVVSDGYGTVTVGGLAIPFGLDVARHVALPVDLDGDADLDLVVTCLIPWTSPGTRAVHLGVLWNRYRDLEAVALPRVAQPYRMRLRGHTAVGMLAVLATSPGALPAPVPVPGIEGALVVDPATMFLWGLSVVPDATTAVESVLPLAADPTLVGLEVATQALFVPVDGITPMGLSNGLVHTLQW